MGKFQYTLMCLSIGTPKNNKFSIFPNGKFIIFRCPKILVDYSLITMCLNTGKPKNINFSFETNGKLMALGVPILKHFRVSIRYTRACSTQYKVLLMTNMLKLYYC